MRTLFSTLLLLLVTVGTAFAQDVKTHIHDEASVPRERWVDFSHCLIDISIFPKEGKVKGEVTHTFQPIRKEVDSLFIDGPGITVLSAQLNNQPIEVETISEGLIFRFKEPLQWETTHTLKIQYEAFPSKGMYFIGWQDSTNRSEKQVWTQGQGIDNRHWFPHFDHLNDKLVTETKVTFPDPYKVLSNGVLKKKKSNKDGTTTWHYQMSRPHASYLVMLGIGEYNIREVKSESGVPLRMYYYPKWENRVPTAYLKTKEMFDWFEQYIGVEYPWESYSQIPVQDYLYGAMENTTATVFGDFFFTDERGFLDKQYVYVNAHELAHQWFGDMVTARSSEAHWLHESFATYYHGLWQGQVFGEQAFDWMMRNNQLTALKAGEKDDYPIRDSRAGSARHYMKGAFVLKMLNTVLGEEAYRKVIKDYLLAHRYQSVDTEDLLTQIHETLGESLDWFFDQWVYRGGEPAYQVSFIEKVSNASNQGVFLVKQVQKHTETVGYFKMPIDFEVHLKSGKVVKKTAWIENTSEEVHLSWPANETVDFVLFDPNNKVLKTVEFEKPLNMLLSQANKAEFMLDRVDALEALRLVPTEKKLQTYKEIFNREDFYAIHSEIARQLMNYPELSIDWKEKMLTHSSHEVRRAALSSLSSIDPELRLTVEEMLLDSSYQNVELALDKLMDSYLENAEKYLEKVENELGDNHQNVRLAWLKYQWLLNADKKPYEKELADLAGRSFEFITRQNAANLCKELNILNRDLFKSLVDGALSNNRKLKNNHASVIRFYAVQFDKNQAMLYWLNELPLTQEEKKAIRKYLS